MLIGDSRRAPMGNTQGTVSLCLLPSSDFAHSIKIDGSAYVLDGGNDSQRVSESCGFRNKSIRLSDYNPYQRVHFFQDQNVSFSAYLRRQS
jgi:hypothetical protein